MEMEKRKNFPLPLTPAGIEPESPVWYTNEITTTPRPLLIRLVK